MFLAESIGMQAAARDQTPDERCVPSMSSSIALVHPIFGGSLRYTGAQSPARFRTPSLSWKVARWAYRMLPTIVGTPILTSGKEKVASSEAMMKSHVAAAVSPAHRAHGAVGQSGYRHARSS